jgi:Bestrophin, RFP-TM, chloride channel
MNVALMVILIVVDRHYGDPKQHVMNVSALGHTFLSLVVAFLLVSRVNIGLARYNTARDAIGTMYREARELVQGAAVLSNTCHATTDQEWRHEVSYRCLLLLKTAVTVIEFPTDGITPWDTAELNGVELDDVQRHTYLVSNSNTNRRWAHGERTVWEEVMRVPIRVAYLIRQSIHSQSSKRLTEPIPVQQENLLLARVDAFMGGYYNIVKFLTTVRVSRFGSINVHAMHWCCCLRSHTSFGFTRFLLFRRLFIMNSRYPFLSFKWLERLCSSMSLQSPLSCFRTTAVTLRVASWSLFSPMALSVWKW